MDIRQVPPEFRNLFERVGEPSKVPAYFISIMDAILNFESSNQAPGLIGVATLAYVSKLEKVLMFYVTLRGNWGVFWSDDEEYPDHIFKMQIPAMGESKWGKTINLQMQTYADGAIKRFMSRAETELEKLLSNY